MEVKMMILKGLIRFKEINQASKSFFKSSKLIFVIFLFAFASLIASSVSSFGILI
ncbi:hypothetical protein SDC9_14316 [bioreactor metagenome]|uniref:Uncharacterized protein n=1 Tax=bioreactor metagenome TaxID=1076179 RepID=A0A644TNN3_9ZZZZ